MESLESRLVLSTFTVVNEDDAGPGSLREAIDDANMTLGEDEIVFADSVNHISLSSGELDITDDVEIEGPGAHELTISGGDASRVFNIFPDVEATIADLTIAEGLADGEADDVPGAGGGVLNRGSLTLSHVVMRDNHALGGEESIVFAGPALRTVGGAFGGAVANFGALTVDESYFRNNQATGADDVDFVPPDPTVFRSAHFRDSPSAAPLATSQAISGRQRRQSATADSWTTRLEPAMGASAPSPATRWAAASPTNPH